MEGNGQKHFAVYCCHNVLGFFKSKIFAQPSLYNNYIFLLMIPMFLCLVSFFSSGCSKYLHIRKKEMFCLPKEGRMEGRKYTTGARLISENSEISNDTSLTECKTKCGVKVNCLALNFNVNSLQCEVLSSSTFSINVERRSDWDYYGADVC